MHLERKGAASSLGSELKKQLVPVYLSIYPMLLDGSHPHQSEAWNLFVPTSFKGSFKLV